MPTRKLIESTLGAITVEGDLGNWRIAAASELPEPGQIISTGSVKGDVDELLRLLTEKGAL